MIKIEEYKKFKRKTDFEKNIILRYLVKDLKKIINKHLNTIEGLLQIIKSLKGRMKYYGREIQSKNNIIRDLRQEIKDLNKTIKSKDREIYKYITNKYIKNGKS